MLSSIVEQAWPISWVLTQFKSIDFLEVVWFKSHLNVTVPRISDVGHIVIEIFSVGLTPAEEHLHSEVATGLEVVFVLRRVAS